MPEPRPTTIIQRWRIFKRTGEWDDVIEGLDTGETGDGGTEVVSVEALLSSDSIERMARKIAEEFGFDWVFDEAADQEMYDAPYWRHIARQAMRAALSEEQR